MCTVASAPAAFRVRVRRLMTCCSGPRTGRPPPEGANVGYALAPVPEPSTVVLSLTALVFMGTMYFRRHRKGAVKSFALGKRTDPVLPTIGTRSP